MAAHPVLVACIVLAALALGALEMAAWFVTWWTP